MNSSISENVSWEFLENKANYGKNLSALSLDAKMLHKLWFSMQVAKIIAFVWNQDHSKDVVEFKNQYENTQEVYDLLNSAAISLEKLSRGLYFDELEESDKYNLVFAFSNNFLSDEWCNVTDLLKGASIKDYEIDSYIDLSNKLKSLKW